MKYCTKCGKELNDGAVICINCGCAVNSIHNNLYSVNRAEKDTADAGLVVISALFPIVGFILWAVKFSETPNAARTYGIAALIACGAWVVISVFTGLVISDAVGSFMSILFDYI